MLDWKKETGKIEDRQIIVNGKTMNEYFLELSKSICEIKIEREKGTKIGIGLLLNFPINHEIFYCQITNEHLILKDY